MSKKLIAVASAAALALAALVGITPASASASFDVTATDANGDDQSTHGSAATALVNRALETNELAAADIVTFTVDGNIAGTSFTVQATGGVKVTDEVTNEDGDALPLSAGKSSLPSTKYGAIGGSSLKTFYAYTTSTTPGKVTVTSTTGASEVFYIASEVGQAYNIAVTFPTSVPVSSTGGTSTTGARVYLVVTDVFGNALKTAGDFAEDVTSGDIVIDALGADIVNPTVWTYDAKRKQWKNDEGITSPRSGNVAMSVELTGDPDLTSVGLPAAKTMAFKTISVRSLEDQVAALQAQLANTVSKAKYNNLVVKYNKITRGKKAKLVK
jgi:hypothetical protein